jgi:hypothetical protein
MIRILAIAALVGVASTAHAQGVPPITRSKDVATKAANAASARVRRQEQVTAEPSADTTLRGARTPALAAREPSPASRGVTSTGTAVDSVRPELPGASGELVLMREIFRYESGGRRDPFVSLMQTGELRPVINDLRLIGVIYDPTGRRSLATLRDVSTNELYRVAVGNVLGRVRVTHILPKQVTVTIEEFGFSRQQALILGDTTATRTNR